MTHAPLTQNERAARRRAKTQPIFARTERQDVIDALDRLVERTSPGVGRKRRALEDAILAADAATRAD